jgi:hypothetical protein
MRAQGALVARANSNKANAELAREKSHSPAVCSARACDFGRDFVRS